MKMGYIKISIKKMYFDFLSILIFYVNIWIDKIILSNELVI